jgi:MFS family permease
MYQVESARTLLKRGAARSFSGRGVGRTVVLLGLVSLLTDLSSEMVTTVLPLYLVYSVGLSPLQFGVVDGLNQGAAALVRVASGAVGDRLHRHKEVAVVGYGLSALVKPLLVAAGGAFSAITALIAVDRVGKGIRTAPRDALISLSTPPESLGAAFGVHRALDTAGAMLGPLVAFGLLALAPDSFNSIFIVSFAFAFLGVGLLALFVPGAARPDPEARRFGMADVKELLLVPRYRTLVLVASALALATISDAFVYLSLQDRLDFDPRYLPLLFVGGAVAYMLLAVPAGRLADRVGRARVFVLGYVLLLVLYALLLTPLGIGMLLLALPLLGSYYAATDGVLMAAASEVVPARSRGTGLAVLGTATNLGRLGGSVAFGAVWTLAGADWAVVTFAAALSLGLAAAFLVLRSRSRP